MPAPIGIDLGTTFSCVATIGPSGEPEAITNFEGDKTTPSVVAYSNGEIYVGKPAVRSVAPTTNIIYDSKRFIGRQFDDHSVQADIKLWPFNVVSNEGKPLVKLTQNGEEKKLAAEKISAEVLKMMKMIAEKYLNEEVTKAVITVPANFDQRQRHETVEAAKLVGIEVIRMINEPTAAAIAYGVHNEGTNTVLVYDLGGGTFDVSIVKCEGNKKLQIIATAGHKHLGGQDFDIIIRDYVLTQFDNFPKNKPRMMKRLLEMCAEGKIGLSSHETATISVDGEDQIWTMELTRSKFDELCGRILRGTLDIVDEALRQAGMQESDINNVILAGGSTRIPMVQGLLKEKFGQEKLWNRHNPDEVVAKGAALVAKALARSPSNDSLQLIFNDIVPLSIGQELNGGLMKFAIESGTKYPYKVEQITELAQDNQKSVYSNIYEGERKQSKNNFKIGNIELNLKDKNSRRGHKIKTIYEIDQSGLLHVTMAEVKNGNSASITIQYDGCPHKDANIENIVAEAKEHEEEDYELQMLILTWAEFERQIYQIKHSVEDDKSMNNDNKQEIFKIVNEYLEWAEEIPKPMELYEAKMKEFINMLQEYYPSVDEMLTPNNLGRDIVKTWIT